MPSNGSTSARAPACYCTACPLTFERTVYAYAHCDISGHQWTIDPARAFRAPATPPRDETPFIVDNTLGQVRVAGSTACECGHRAGDHDDTNAEGQADGILGQCFECNCAIFRLPAARAPLVDTGGPTATNVSESPLEPLLDGRAVRFVLNDEGAKHAVASMVYRAALDGGLTPSDAATIADGVFTSFGNEGTDRGKETVLLIKSIVQATKDALVAVRSPSPEGTGTPPTPSELPSQTELGVGVAGELPGVGAADVRRFGGLSNEAELLRLRDVIYIDLGTVEPNAVRDWITHARAEVAALRLRAEAAERQLATFTQADIDALNLYVAVGVAACAASGGTSHGILNGGWAQEQADSLIARIAATLSSQRTL